MNFLVKFTKPTPHTPSINHLHASLDNVENFKFPSKSTSWCVLNMIYASHQLSWNLRISLGHFWNLSQSKQQKAFGFMKPLTLKAHCITHFYVSTAVCQYFINKYFPFHLFFTNLIESCRYDCQHEKQAKHLIRR